MTLSPRIILFLVSPLLLNLITRESQGGSGMEKGGWSELSAEELTAEAPRIDPNAHTELLYRELVVDDAEATETVFSHHYRAKLFSETAVGEWDKIDIPYQTGWRVYGVRARVVYPDGSVALLNHKDVYKRQIFKDGQFTGYAKSFSFPGLRPGCIVEYKWSEARAYWAPSFSVPLRAEWPTWKFDLSVDPYKGMASRIARYNCDVTWEKRRGKYLLSISDQPAVSSKPFLAPRKDFEPFVYMGYALRLEALGPEKYWNYRGGGLVEINKSFVKGRQKHVKEKADELFKDVTFNEDMLRAAYDYCASGIINIEEHTTSFTEQEIEDLKENKSPAQTIRNGYGTRYDINAVFASLAAAAGFSAHLAQVENHSEYTYNTYATGSFNLSDWVVAIRQGEGWRYFDPGSSFLPFETLNPENVEADTIQTDKDYYYMATTKPVPNEFSTVNRVGEVSINEYGDLEGIVMIQYNGYSGLWRKRLFAGMTEKERETYVLESDWQNRLPRTAIEDFVVKHEDSRDEALELTYKIKIPGFADRAGDRLLIRPSLFEQGAPARFTDEERVEHLAFDHKARVLDKISYTLPAGLELSSENSADGSYDGASLIRRSLVSVKQDAPKFDYLRYFQLKLTMIDGRFYKRVKADYDYVNESDNRPVVFTNSEAVTSLSSLK